MKTIKYHWLALLFAILSCIISPLDRSIAKAYPDLASKLYYRDGRFYDKDTMDQYGWYRGYTVRERVRAGISLLRFAFCLLAFFIGRAGVRGPQGRKRDICLIAATIAICSSGGEVSLILFLVLMHRLQQKAEVPAEQMAPQAPDTH